MMNIVVNSKIAGIISWIKETEMMIETWKKHQPDPAANLMVLQFEDLKRDFVKQLLAELLQSPHNMADIEPFIFRATNWLRKFDRKDFPAGDLPANLKEVEYMMHETT